MRFSLEAVVLLAWVPILVALFRLIGPSRAVLVGGVGGMLFLPRGGLLLGLFPLYKSTSTGLGLLLGLLLFDFWSLARSRPRLRDLGMIVYGGLAPFAVVAGGMNVWRDALDQTFQRVLGIGVPYFAARVTLGDRSGPRRVLAAIVAGGMLYVPLCGWEELLGPPFYLSKLIYSSGYQAGQVSRLGGWRPEVFLGNGLELASWIAVAAVGAVGMMLSRERLLPRLPEWVPALVLVLTAFSCRGVYGYVLVALGLPVLGISWGVRTRAALIVLALVPPLYIGLRTSGAWDGRALASVAGGLDRITGGNRQRSSVGFRLQAEEDHLAQFVPSRLPLGFGSYVWNGPRLPWPDGFWIHLLWSGGLAGISAWLLALELVPVEWALTPHSHRSRSRPDLPPGWTVALLLILAAIDSLHNAAPSLPTALMAGGLMGGRDAPREAR